MCDPAAALRAICGSVVWQLKWTVGYRSGQTGQTVNLLAMPSQVRILHPPLFGGSAWLRQDVDRRKRSGLGGSAWLAPRRRPPKETVVQRLRLALAKSSRDILEASAGFGMTRWRHADCARDFGCASFRIPQSELRIQFAGVAQW